MPRKTETDTIFKRLGHYHDGKFGYVVYRCTYGDDAAWARFMEILTEHVKYGLEDEKRGQEVKTHFAWTVMDSEETFDGAAKAYVRQQFRGWVESVGGSRALPKYNTCIYADEDVVHAVLTGDQPGDIADHTSFVILLDGLRKEEPKPESLGDATPVPYSEESDEYEEPIEGCRKRDVGWTKTATSLLVPRDYALLQDGDWDLVYRRPPEISVP